MNRRDILRILGGVTAAPLLPLAAEERLALGRDLHARAQGPLRTLNAQQNALVTQIAELIIPRTDTPGATDVRVTEFIDLLLTEWYDAAERDRVLAGLAALEARNQASPSLVALLESLDGVRGEPASAEWTFERLKSLTVYGYFTSETVQRDVLHHQPLPGRFDGCVPI